jgi:hypothetical protein
MVRSSERYTCEVVCSQSMIGSPVDLPMVSLAALKALILGLTTAAEVTRNAFIRG